MDRHLGPKTLIENKISCIICAEDALKYYGVPTAVFDLSCLVDDPNTASKCLQEKGFSLICESSRPGYQLMPELTRGRPRLFPCPNEVKDTEGYNSALVLLPASFWSYETATLSRDLSQLYPELPLFLTGLIDGWISAEDVLFSAYIGNQIAYLYQYVPQVREPSFQELLKAELHKEFHAKHMKECIWESQKQYFKDKRDLQAA